MNGVGAKTIIHKVGGDCKSVFLLRQRKLKNPIPNRREIWYDDTYEITAL